MTSRLTALAATLIFISSVQITSAENITVKATYKVEFGGFDLGNFKFQSNQSKDAYNLKGSTKLSILKGAVMKWKMNIQSSGKFLEQNPEPQTFSYNFKDGKKKKKRAMNLKFIKDQNGQMNIEPMVKRSKKRIPIEQKHLENVFDPMSALILLTNTKEKKLSRNVCNQTLKLFDGKERYDIALRYKKIATTKVGKKKRLSYVCSLKYIPVAGHKKKDRTKNYMAKVKGIEVWFTPFKQAHLYVPHKISIPTPFGPTTTIRARNFQIKKNQNKPINFIR